MASAGIKTNGTGTAGVLSFNSVDGAQWDAGGTWIPPVTANLGTFDLSTGQNFICTPTAGFTFTFTNMTGRGGKSGTIILNNPSGYTVAKAATTYVDGNFLPTVSSVGTYRISYYTDGTNVHCTTSLALS